jgi:hypothetical protein
MALSNRTSQQLLIESFYELEIVSHLSHVNTRSFSEHNAFGDFYGKIGGFKDFLVEYLMGEGKLDKLSLPMIDPSSETVSLADSLSEKFIKLAHEQNCEALINKAGEFEEVVAHLKYMLMLK